jgi:ribose/xylose/arabinose/galactoside ABC-type transport system permease subunit
MSDLGRVLIGLGRVLIGLGLLLVVVGAVVMLAGKTGLPLGRLPGDFTWRGRHTTVYFPLATSILISVVLSLALWLMRR